VPGFNITAGDVFGKDIVASTGKVVSGEALQKSLEAIKGACGVFCGQRWAVAAAAAEIVDGIRGVQVDGGGSPHKAAKPCDAATDDDDVGGGRVAMLDIDESGFREPTCTNPYP
jgi:hypothetical protein